MTEYKRVEKIDSGGFGVVYRAIRTNDGKEVAIKELSGADLSEADLGRFRREVRLQARLQHPHIAPIIAYDLDAFPPWFAMPLAGCNLREMLPSIQGNAQLANTIFAQLLDALEYAHRNGVIHRDLKPENILVTQSASGGQLFVISDFGLGRELSRQTPTITPSHVGIGTPPYAAPEQLLDLRQADQRSDIYALGKMMYEILTGEYPVNPDVGKVPGGLAYVIERCIRPEREERYQSVEDLRRDFLLVTERGQLFDQPVRMAKNLVQEIRAGDGISEEDVRKLDEVLRANNDDEEVYLATLPELPKSAIQVYWEVEPHNFKGVLSRYDGYVSGGLPFDYTDRVAGFYYAVFEIVGDLGVRRMILTRLLDMGDIHNRWHVMNMFWGLLHGISDPSLALVAREVLEGNPSAVAATENQLQNRSLVPILKQAVDHILSESRKPREWSAGS